MQQPHYYTCLEQIAVKEKTVYLFEKIITLWINLNTLAMDTGEHNYDIQKHKDVIDSLYNYLISDCNKKNRTLVARAAYQLVRPFCGESIDAIVETYIDIVNQSQNSLEVSISQINKIVSHIPIFQEATRYDELFELLVRRISEEEEHAAASRMLAKRAHDLAEKEPYKALGYFSRALMGFYNEANTEHLTAVLFEMANCFEQIGLFWAARSYYFYVLTYCFNQYMLKGEII